MGFLLSLSYSLQITLPRFFLPLFNEFCWPFSCWFLPDCCWLEQPNLSVVCLPLCQFVCPSYRPCMSPDGQVFVHELSRRSGWCSCAYVCLLLKQKKYNKTKFSKRCAFFINTFIVSLRQRRKKTCVWKRVSWLGLCYCYSLLPLLLVLIWAFKWYLFAPFCCMCFFYRLLLRFIWIITFMPVLWPSHTSLYILKREELRYCRWERAEEDWEGLQWNEWRELNWIECRAKERVS